LKPANREAVRPAPAVEILPPGMVLLSGAFLKRFGRRLARLLAVLDRRNRCAPGRFGNLPLGVFFVRRRDRADRVAPRTLPAVSRQVTPRPDRSMARGLDFLNETF